MELEAKRAEARQLETRLQKKASASRIPCVAQVGEQGG